MSQLSLLDNCWEGCLSLLSRFCFSRDSSGLSVELPAAHCLCHLTSPRSRLLTERIMNDFARSQYLNISDEHVM